jgi:DNA helicase HerA-like ATPase
VLFFDEAHLLFDSAPKPLLEKIEQVVRLIRSKGVGVYFITQSPLDLPQAVLGQLGLKVQHALRAFTPDDRKVIKAVARSFRAREGLDVERVVTELATGEALVSTLDDQGSPAPVARTLVRPPESRIGALTAEERRECIARSPLRDKYTTRLDRESAYEVLKTRAAAAAPRDPEPTEEPTAKAGGRRRESAAEAMLKSTVRAIGSSLGRQLVRGILGSLSRGR